MIAVTYRVSLREPLLATALDGEPNSAVSADFIPGSAIRGALVAHFLHQSQRSCLDAADSLDRRLFLDGSTCFLNAYPIVLGIRSFPIPLSWYHEKDEVGELFDLAVERTQLGQPVRPSAPFHCADPDNDSVTSITPERRFTIHTQRERRRGRPGRDEGAIFRYVALAPDQSFAGAILCASHEDALLFQRLLESETGRLRLGRSRSAGYGLVEVDRVQIEDDWHEVDANREEGFDDERRFTLTLLSDLALRDQFGRSVCSAKGLRVVLAERLGLLVDSERSFLATHAVGGFSRAWGMPLPQTPVLAMGSVFVFTWSNPPSTDSLQRLRSLAEHGLGERRVEGFGRVALNWYGRTEWRVAPPDRRMRFASVNLRAASDSDAARLAGRIMSRVQVKQIDRGLLAQANHIVEHAEPKGASAALLNRLHAVVVEVLADFDERSPAENVQRVRTFTEKLRDRQTTRRPLEQVRVQGQPLLDWIDARLAAPEESWREITAQESGRLTIGGIEPRPNERWQVRVSFRLIEGVLARLAKRVANDPDRGGMH